MEKLIIDRKKWLRGTRIGSKLLKKTTRKMCCLGFFVRQCGFKIKDIENITSPEIVVAHNKQISPDNLIYRLLRDGRLDSDITYELMRINDSNKISEEVREKELTRLFKKIKFEVEFIN